MSAKWVAVVALLAFASATIAAQSFDADDEGRPGAGSDCWCEGDHFSVDFTQASAFKAKAIRGSARPCE